MLQQQSAVKNAEINLGYSTVRAPISGQSVVHQ
jgi:multidrug efflux pump subunit AcrA (membrane-fusion protein)